MENGRKMLMHSVVIGLVLYVVMFYVLGQSQSMAENRSILIAALALIYMLMIGHRLPSM